MRTETHFPDASIVSGWRKSSYSGGGDDHGGGSCLEVADALPGIVPVRDSKNPQGPALVFRARSWAAFVGAVRAGEFAG